MTLRGVSPFGHPGITGRVLLPPAYRSLPRPSSPPCAQASPARLRSLDYVTLRQAEHAHELQSYFHRTRLMQSIAPSASMRIQHPTIYLIRHFSNSARGVGVALLPPHEIFLSYPFAQPRNASPERYLRLVP